MSANTDTTPFGPFEWMFATRYLRPRRKEGLISVIAIISFLGIMLGVATLISVMALFTGVRQELTTKLLGLNGHFIVSKVGEAFTDYDATRERLERVPHVAHVMPVIEGQALFSNAAATGFSVAVLVRGMRAGDIASLKLVSGGLRGGSLDGFDDGQTIALGMRLAMSLGVNVGDQVKLITNRGKSTVFGSKPNTKNYTVSALFEIGMAEYDKTIAFLPLHEAQAFFNYPNQANVLEIMVHDPDTVKAMTPAIEAQLGKGYTLSDWEQRNATILSVIDVERNLMFFVVSLITIVAMLNVISGLTMLVKDKGRDVAILRTMGATPGSVMRIFLMTGAAIGIVGTIAGLILAILFCTYVEEIRSFIGWVTGTTPFDPNVYVVTKLKAVMDPVVTGSIVLGSMILSVLATIVPSWRASRIDPVEALRYE